MKKPISIEEQLNLTSMECEVITLKAILDMVNEMVNHEKMQFNFNDPDSSVLFKSATHKALFNILLVDFLSTPGEFFKEKGSYLERLHLVCQNPQLGLQDVTDLLDSVQMLLDWMQQEVIVEKRWFHSLGLEIDLQVERQQFIKMCGNISKHNFTQQTRQAKILSQILHKNGQTISVAECLIVLEDFYQHFYEDIFTYHASTIAEFLNNIRWGIYQYVQFERKKAVIEWVDEEHQLPAYKYKYPDQIKSKLAQKYYWDLLNDVKKSPYIQKFVVTKYLKMRY